MTGRQWRQFWVLRRLLDLPSDLDCICFAGVRECPPWCSIVGATVTVHQFFCILHFCLTCSLCRVELVVQFPAKGSTQVLLYLFPGCIVASHGIWVRLLLPPYRGCLSVFDLDSMNILWPHSTNQMATWNSSSWYSEAILVQWNDTFYKPFGLNDKQRYAAHAQISRLFYRPTVSCPVV